MKIHKHAESHIVELSDGSKWSIFAGDLDLTLGWLPDIVSHVDDPCCTHVLKNDSDQTRVRVIKFDDSWAVNGVKESLRAG